MTKGFDKSIKWEHAGRTYSADFILGDVGTYNCAIKALCNFLVYVEGQKPGSFAEWRNREEKMQALGCKAFGEAIMSVTDKAHPPTMFFLSDNLVRDYRVKDRSRCYTSDVIAALIRSKHGSVVASPIYNNSGHPIPDSLQMAIMWWPESQVKHILFSRPYWRIPLKKIREGIREMWRYRMNKRFYSAPHNLHDAVEMVLKAVGWSGRKPNPIPKEPEQKEEEKTELEW